MRTAQLICIIICFCVLFDSCYSSHMIDTQDMIEYEKSKIISIEMMSGEMVDFRSDKIIMSKQDKYGILLYYKDGSSRKFNMEDILRIRIKQYDYKKTIYMTYEWFFFLPTILYLAAGF